MLRILKSQFIGNLTLKPYFESIKILASRTSLFKHLYLKEDRLQRLIDKMEAVSGWKSRKKKEGFVTAITERFGTTVGQIVKASKHGNGKIKVDKVWAVVDCGWYVNPDTIKAQVEGSVVMALGAAIIHENHF